MKERDEYQPSKKIDFHDPQSNYLDRKVKSRSNMEADILCNTMFELWLAKQNDSDKVLIVLLLNKYEYSNIMEICRVSQSKLYNDKKRLMGSLKEWFVKFK